MCFGQEQPNEMVITSTDPNKSLREKAKEYGLEDQLPQEGALDLTDPKLGAARKSQLLKMLSGRGRSSTFLTGPSGATDFPGMKK